MALRSIRVSRKLPGFIEKLLLLVLQVLQLLCLLREVPCWIVPAILVLSLTQSARGILNCICRLLRRLLLLLRSAAGHGLLHILDGLIELSRRFCNLRILRIASQLLQLTLKRLSFAQQIPLRSLIRGAATTLSRLSRALTCRCFLAFGQIGEFLCQLIDFLLGLLILLASRSLTTLNLFVLVLAGIQFQSEKIGEILRAPRSTTTATSTASAALLHLNLGVKGRRIGQILQRRAFKVSCSSRAFPCFS